MSEGRSGLVSLINPAAREVDSALPYLPAILLARADGFPGLCRRSLLARMLGGVVGLDELGVAFLTSQLIVPNRRQISSGLLRLHQIRSRSERHAWLPDDRKLVQQWLDVIAVEAAPLKVPLTRHQTALLTALCESLDPSLMTLVEVGCAERGWAYSPADSEQCHNALERALGSGNSSRKTTVSRSYVFGELGGQLPIDWVKIQVQEPAGCSQEVQQGFLVGLARSISLSGIEKRAILRTTLNTKQLIELNRIFEEELSRHRQLPKHRTELCMFEFAYAIEWYRIQTEGVE